MTNNLYPTGLKAGLSTEGCWDTEQTIATPAGDAKLYPDGPYTVLISGSDILGNSSDDSNPVNSRTITVLNDYEHVLYVDDDFYGDGSLEDPFHSITEAVPFGRVDTLIYVAPGTYSSDESFPIDPPEGTTLIGAGQEHTIIAGDGNHPVFRIDQNSCRMSGFTVKGGGNAGIGHVVVENNPSYTIIENCTIEGDCTSQVSGIYLHHVNYPLISTCVILNHAENGVLLNDVWKPDIANCTFDNNNIGINADDGVICALIINSIFTNHYKAIRAYKGSYLGIISTDFYLSGSPWYISDGSSAIFTEYVIEMNPLFDGGMYYLHPTSLCVDWGSVSGWFQYGAYYNAWQIGPPLYLRTTRFDNLPFPGGLYDDGYVDLGFHYIPVKSTPTPFPTVVPTDTPLPTNTPTSIPTRVPGFGYVHLDSPDYFTEGDTAEILVLDPDLNTNPSMAESYDVYVSSDTIYPTTIPMTVTEISIDSEYFTTSAAGTDLGFTTGPSVPYSEIQISDGDEITVMYDNATPPGQRTDSSVWHSAIPPTETPFPTTTPTTTSTSTETPTTTPTAYPGAFYEDFESGALGWVADGLWHLTTRYCHSLSHSMWYADEDLEHYATGGPNSGSLTSPPILLESGYTTLTFRSREETDGARYWDTRKVYISNNDDDLWDLLYQSYNNDNLWYQPQVIDLSDYTGEIIRIRFEFDTVDDGDNVHLGWMIDDVAIDDSPLPLPALGMVGKLTLLMIFFVLMALCGKKSVLQKK